MESLGNISASFLEQHPHPILIYDAETMDIKEVNQSAAETYGWSRNEFKNMGLQELKSPDNKPELFYKLRNLDQDSKIAKLGTFQHQNSEGETLQVQVSEQHLSSADKEFRILHINDLTDIVELQNRISESYEDQQKHLYNSPLAMVKYDENFRIIEWSKRAEEKTGYNREEVLGISTFKLDLFDKDEVDYVKERLLEFSRNKKRDRFETTIRLKSGDPMHVRVHASALNDNNGNLKSVLAFIQHIDVHQKHQRQLEQRERKYHRLFEEATDGILLMHDLTIIECNEKAKEMVGARRKDELIGKSPLYFSPETQPDGRLSLDKAREKVELAKEGDPQIFNWKYRSFDGELKDVEVSLNKIVLGTDDYTQVVIRNLNQHKNVKNKLQAEQKRLKRAQQLAELGWWNYDVAQDRLILSEILYDILNLNEDNFNYDLESFRALVHRDDRGKIDTILRKARRSSEPIDYSLKIKTPDEEILHAQCRVQGESNSQDELTHLSGVLQDITEQKKDQQELKRRKELFESLFLDSPVAIAMIDIDGTVQKVNNSFEELFGYKEEELTGKDLLKYQLPEDRHDEIEENYERLFNDNPASKYIEDQRITKEGKVKNLLVGSLPVSLDGEAIAAFDIYTDITKLRKMEKNLHKSLKEKELLLSEIHHRVKNNLAVISGLFELEAMNWKKDSQVYKVLTDSKLRIHSIASIHEQLYHSEDFANIYLQGYIPDLVETIYNSMHGREKNVDINIDCDDITLNINQAISCALIINELVTNSFKYAFVKDERGRLGVSFNSEKGHMTIVIEDNGPGLPDNYEKMAEESLGHELVNQLVKQLEGDIKVESSPDYGTRYEIHFEKKENKNPEKSHLF